MIDFYNNLVAWVAANPRETLAIAFTIIYCQWMFPFMKKHGYMDWRM